MQQQVHASGGNHDNDDDDQAAGQVEVQSIDALLDHIDTVLESDAQTFVEGFVQKGGQ